MQINKKITVTFIFFLAVIFLLPHWAWAQDLYGINDLSLTEDPIALGTRDLKQIITGIVNVALGFLGILATLIILYGGYIWMTSGGNAEKVDKAKRIIINGVIGLIIILSSYAIARFILREGYSGIFGGSSGPGTPGYSGGTGLGNGVIENHYPAANATGVYMNTNIYVTFKEPMNPEFIVNDTDCGGVDCEAREDYIELYRSGSPDDALTNENLLVTYDPDDLTVFEFNPYGYGTDYPDDYLGDGYNEVAYTMFLGDLETGNGQVAFPLGHYSWDFSVGTEVDLTPPRVTSAEPSGEYNPYPRNSVVQINFSEAVSPFIALTNVTLENGGAAIPGEFHISNQYRTIEFVSTNDCGTNSCGETVYCLPGDADGEIINGIVGHDIIDMAGNNLDCGDNCNAALDYIWDFETNGVIDLSVPTISSMQPSDSVSLIDPIEVTFSRRLMGSSVNTDTIDFEPADINYSTSLGGDENNIIMIHHDRFTPAATYRPILTSGIRDTLQNCWFPCECDADDASCVCETPACSGGSCTGDPL